MWAAVSRTEGRDLAAQELKVRWAMEFEKAWPPPPIAGFGLHSSPLFLPSMGLASIQWSKLGPWDGPRNTQELWPKLRKDAPTKVNLSFGLIQLCFRAWDLASRAELDFSPHMAPQPLLLDTAWIIYVLAWLYSFRPPLDTSFHISNSWGEHFFFSVFSFHSNLCGMFWPYELNA